MQRCKVQSETVPSSKKANSSFTTESTRETPASGGNREQGTGNREQGTGNREQGTGCYQLDTVSLWVKIMENIHYAYECMLVLFTLTIH